MASIAWNTDDSRSSGETCAAATAPARAGDGARHDITVDARGPIVFVEVMRALPAPDRPESAEALLDLALPDQSVLAAIEVRDRGRWRAIETAAGASPADVYRSESTTRGVAPTFEPFDDASDYRLRLQRAQIARGDSRWIERLHEGQRLLGLLKLLGRGVRRQQIAEAGAKVAAILGIERADDPLAERQCFFIHLELAKLVHQIVLQRFGALGYVGDHIVRPLGILFDSAGRPAGRFLEILRHLAVEVQ